MKQLVLVGVVAAISALGFSSCAYDPYYSSSSSYGGQGSYGGYGGYGDGYGYGGSGFSTSFFVSTGNSRWAYDPYAGAYYDYSRRSYYDPYLYGYYPVGYRPRYVYGSPHPHGWYSGSNYCAPPSDVRSYTLTNYRDRAERYRSLDRSWSSNVRVNNPTIDQHPSNASRDQRSPYTDRTSSSPRPSYDDRSSNTSGFSGDRSSGSNKTNSSQQRKGSSQQDTRNRDSSRFDGSSSRGGFTPPTVSPQPSRDRSQQGGYDRSGGRSEPARSAPQMDNRSKNSDSERSRGNSDRSEEKKMRGLGQG